MSATEGHGHDSHGRPAATEALTEPKTPMWLPALGALLFLLAGLWWGASGGSAPAGQAEGAPAASASAAAAPDGGAQQAQ